MALLSNRLGNTLFLAGLSAVMAVPLALSLGILAALFRNSTYDRLASAISLASISFPDFLAAYILILVFSVELNLFPSMSLVSPTTPFWMRVYRCLLPALTLTVLMTAHMMRMTRAALVDLLSRSYIEMAHLKGIHRLRIILWHTLP